MSVDVLESIAYTISIHALRVEGDSELHNELLDGCLFLSTPSGWRATSFGISASKSIVISIHALRVEGDMKSLKISVPKYAFLSTPSGWRATYALADQMAKK